MLIASSALAQRNNVVILKNGSEIRGRLLESEKDKVKVLKSDGSIMVFDKSEVAAVEKFGSKVSRSGYFCRIDGGIIGGSSDASPSLHVVNGYAVNNRWQFGVGLGIEALDWNAHIPIFADARFHILKKSRSTPFIYATSGYAMPMSNWDQNKGGYTGGCGIGMSHSFQFYGQVFGLTTSMGYRFGWIRSANGWWDDFITVRQLNRFEIRFGFTIR